jgi:signal peptidase I
VKTNGYYPRGLLQGERATRPGLSLEDDFHGGSLLSFPQPSATLLLRLETLVIKYPMEDRNSTPEDDLAPARTEPGAGKPKLILELKSWLRDIVLALATAIFIVVFVVQPVKVEGTSMQPHLIDQERIFVNRFIYRFAEIERGDVVVFWYPRDTDKSFIKRVVGIPGDSVEIRRGLVYVNGEKIREPYLRPEFRDRDSYHKVIVPPNRYFVLGDHRSSSNDSRNWGFVPNDMIYGKAIFSYWPISRLGLVD